MSRVQKILNKGGTIIKKEKGFVTVRTQKKFNLTAFIILTALFNIFGLIGYLIYYALRSEWQDKLMRDDRRDK